MRRQNKGKCGKALSEAKQQVNKARSKRVCPGRTCLRLSGKLHGLKIHLILLPEYCPEFNLTDEPLNQDDKTNALGKSRLRDKAEMMANVRSHLHRRQKKPAVVQNLFHE